MENVEPLELVVSLAEACEIWQVDRKTIIWRYWYQDVKMRKSGRIWLVDVKSMLDSFGYPSNGIAIKVE